MTLTILSLEDEADVRDALERDLEQFWDKIRLEVAEDVDDAWAVIDEIVEDGDELALVLSDHRLPGKSGVDFLVELMKDERFGATRTVLVTGQADQSDTIRAVNQAGLDYYIGKPWNPDELRAVVRDQLTEYVLETDVDPLPYVSVLDGVRVMEGPRNPLDKRAAAQPTTVARRPFVSAVGASSCRLARPQGERLPVIGRARRSQGNDVGSGECGENCGKGGPSSQAHRAGEVLDERELVEALVFGFG